MAKKMDDCYIISYDKNIELVSNEYVNYTSKLDWKCYKGHKFSRSLRDMTYRKGCPICSGLLRPEIPELIESISKLNIKCTNIHKYINNKTILDWVCEKGHTWTTRAKMIREGYGCPHCRYKTEDKVRTIFENIFNKKFPSVRPDWLVNPSTGYKLELDGYCEELKIAFEYDGKQHYKEIEFFSGSLRDIVERDIVKDVTCHNNNVTLLRIPYFAKKELELYIKNLLGDIYG